MAVIHVLFVAALLSLLAVMHFDTNLRYTFDRSAVKIDRRILFLVHILQLAISSASRNLFSENPPAPSNYRDR